MNPCEYPATVAIVSDGSLDASSTLDAWRQQGAYLLLIETCSATSSEEEYSAPGCEVHTIRSGPRQHPICAVTAALDLAFAIAPTETLVVAEMGILPARDGLLTSLIAQVLPTTPVAGYRVDDELGTTLAVFRLPSMRAIGASWRLDGWFESAKLPWPDAEQAINPALALANLLRATETRVAFIGDDDGSPSFNDDNIIRERVKVQRGRVRAASQLVAALPYCPHGDPNCPCRSGEQCRYTPGPDGKFMPCYRTGRVTGNCCGVGGPIVVSVPVDSGESERPASLPQTQHGPMSISQTLSDLRATRFR